MRKIALIFAFLIAFGTSCLNEETSQRESIFKEEILNYLNQLQKVSSEEAQKIEELIEAIDLKTASLYDTRGTEKVLILNVKPLKDLGKTDKVLALFFMNQTKIVRSRLVTFANTHAFGEYNNLILSILRMDEERGDYSGKISFYNSLRMLLMQNVLENGALKSNGLVRKGVNKSEADSKINECTEWFLVTTYYYSDGTTETVSRYLYTTCSGCDPFQECDDPNDPYEPGGGGGGGDSTWSFPAEPANNDKASFYYASGKQEVYRFDAATNTWHIIMVVLPPAEITSAYNSFLNVQWPFHGQSILGPNNLLYVYDGYSGVWTGELNFVIDAPSQNDIISSIADYLKCLSLNAAAKVTIFVDQPTANSRSTWSGNPFTQNINVGHTFISIQQGGVTRVFGFYPSESVSPLEPSVSSALVNDSAHPYDVSIEINVTAGQLASVISAVSGFTSVYNLNSYNCTDFGIAIASAAGVTLPDTYGSWPRGGGSNPGDLGQDIRSMSPPSGSTKNTSGGTGPSNSGSCN